MAFLGCEMSKKDAICYNLQESHLAFLAQPCRLTTILEFPMLIVAFAIPLKKRYNNKLVYWQILL